MRYRETAEGKVLRRGVVFAFILAYAGECASAQNRLRWLLNTNLPEMFFGWPSNPPLRAETMNSGAGQLHDSEAISAVPWTSLKVSGRFVIDTILAAIDQADISAFDVTDLNQNVMFELGYSIGRNKKIWLLRDDSDRAARRRCHPGASLSARWA